MATYHFSPFQTPVTKDTRNVSTQTKRRHKRQKQGGGGGGGGGYGGVYSQTCYFKMSF